LQISFSVLNIARVIKILSEIYLNGKDIIINWFYNEDDLEVQEHGEELETLFKVPFELIQNK